MKKFLTLLMATLLCTAAWADTVTFDFTTGYDNAQAITTVSNGGVTLTFDKGTNTNNAPAYYTSGTAVRFYAKNTLTVASTANVTNVVFTFGTGSNDAGMEASPGTWQTPNWTGEATSVVFTQQGTKGHCKIQKIEVTTSGTGEETVLAPTFTPAAGTYYNPVNVEINCGTDDAVIYYTTDGTTPTAASTAYGAAIAVNQSTTLKAIAIKGEKQSEVAEAAYVIETAPANIAEYADLTDNTVAPITGDVTVYYVNGNNLYVKDATGYLCIYGSTGKTYQNGDVIPGGFSGKKTTYNGGPEMATPLTGFNDPTDNNPVAPEEKVTTDVVATAWGQYMLLKNVTISGISGKNMTLTDAAGSVNGYNSFSIQLPADTTAQYNVEGIVATYNNNPQLLITNITNANGSEIQLPEVPNVDSLFNLNSGANARIKSDVVAIYQNGTRLYVKNNNTFTLVYGTLTNTFENGDIIRDAVANWGLYQGVKQLYPVDSTFVVAEKGTAVEPLELPLEEMGQDQVHTYFIIKNAALTDSTITDATMTMKLYNQFNVDLTGINAETQYDVKGFLAVYNQVLQICPIEITEASSAVPGDANGDGVVDISDINIMINMMLGNTAIDQNCDMNGDETIDISDINAVINVMLGKA